MRLFRRYGSLALLGLTPLAVVLALVAPDHQNAIFFTSVVAIVPLAGYIGRATEQLARQLGGGIGGLLNATFGNATELIIGALALRGGLADLTKASITGSIIGNVLLVFGMSALVGGSTHHVQRFNRTAAGLGTTMLLLSAIGLAVPAVFHRLAQSVPGAPQLEMDTEIAVVLFVTYCASLVFTLRTHRDLYGRGAHEGGAQAADARGADAQPSGPGVRSSMLMLVGATAAVGVVSELLVGAVSDAADSLGISQLFIGVIVVGFVGNAAEHYSAVAMAARDDMDAAIAIAVGSSTQIALFVAPVLVFLSYAIGPAPMDLLFTTYKLVAIALSVLSIAFIAHDGETHWMEGVQLLAVYAILALGFYFLPVP